MGQLSLEMIIAYLVNIAIAIENISSGVWEEDRGTYYGEYIYIRHTQWGRRYPKGSSPSV